MVVHIDEAAADWYDAKRGCCTKDKMRHDAALVVVQHGLTAGIERTVGVERRARERR